LVVVECDDGAQEAGDVVEPRQLHLIVETRDAILHGDDIEVGLEERKRAA
jgi:hypothetical protein